MTTYDPAECERLCREAKEDDATIPSAPWRVTKDSAEKSGNRYFPSLLTHEPIGWHDRVVINDSITGNPTTMERYDAIADALARMRNSHRAMADQLEAAGKEMEQAKRAILARLHEDPMRSVAKDRSLAVLVELVTGDLKQARDRLDAYRAARDKAGG